mmetsp:Transcript_56822/g.133179  ORF Transcript_56822/g.133179 Transcript_56822/m.133179 type:complete len:222 (-) Transcript_56822:1209-1874(-)
MRSREGHADADDSGDDAGDEEDAAKANAPAAALLEQLVAAVNDVLLALLCVEDRVRRLRRPPMRRELCGAPPLPACWLCPRLRSRQHRDRQLHFRLAVLAGVVALVGMHEIEPRALVLVILLVDADLALLALEPDLFHLVGRGLALVALEAVLEETFERQNALCDALVRAECVLVPDPDAHQVLQLVVRVPALPLEAVVEKAESFLLHVLMYIRLLWYPHP